MGREEHEDNGPLPSEAAFPKMLFKIVVLKNFAIFTGKHPSWNPVNIGKFEQTDAIFLF